MKHHLLVFLFLLAAMSVQAVPARRSQRIVLQPDGTAVTLSLRGDEWLHYMADEHGTPMCIDSVTGWWREVDIEAQRLARAQSLRTQSDVRREARVRSMAVTRSGTMGGSKRGLVILAEFADVKFVTPDARAVFDGMFNAPDYSYKGMGGSVRDYFLAQSYGRLAIDFDVVGPVTLPHDMVYYGGNNKWGDDLRPGAFASDAIKAAAAMVDYSQYDWDGDKEVDQVFIVYAGYGEAVNGADPNTIWPHEWTLSDAGSSGEYTVRALRYNDVRINTYACSNELIGFEGSELEGVGTPCHEFSHCLGLPDMYDTSGGGSFGMDCWSIMDYGCYNCDGYVPASYTAYERFACGWLQPTMLTTPRTVTAMGNIDDRGECYIIYNSAHANEYYMLQNIQQTGWNIGAAASGMLIMHIDYNARAWNGNTVNNVALHQRVSPVCADNDASYSSLKGDLWPWKGHDELTDVSRPAATLFNSNADGRKFLGHPITAITHQAGKVSFVFDGGRPDAITAPQAAHGDGGDGGFGSACGTSIYDLSGRRVSTPARHGIFIRDGRKMMVK